MANRRSAAQPKRASVELATVSERLSSLVQEKADIDAQLAEWRQQLSSGKGFHQHHAREQAMKREAELSREIQELELKKNEIEDRIAARAEDEARQEKRFAEAAARAERDKRDALELAEREKAQAVEAAIAKTKEEDRAFWFRRFHTSLALAHGAGFAAVGSKLFDPTVDAVTAAGAWYPMSAFAAGMGLAGLIPAALFREAQRPAWLLASISALLFIVALIAALAAIWIKADFVWPWQL